MRHSTKKFFTEPKRLMLRKLLDEKPSISDEEIADYFGISCSTIRKEWIMRGQGANYNPHKKSYHETFTPVTDFEEEKNIRVNNLIQNLIRYARERRGGKEKLTSKICPLIKEYIDLSAPFTIEQLGLYLRVSTWALHRHINKHGGWDKYSVDNLQLPQNISEEGKSHDSEIEALKMHINILYELIEKNKECLE